MLNFLFWFFHIVFSVAIIFVVLWQADKSGGIQGAFGGGTQVKFGAVTAATPVQKLTGWVAVGFMCTSLILSYLTTTTTAMGPSNISPAAVDINSIDLKLNLPQVVETSPSPK